MTPERAPPFRRIRHELDRPNLGLQPLDHHEAPRLGVAFAAIDPWARYRTPPERLAAYFAGVEAETPRFAIRRGNTTIGVAVVHHPWLHGPYLQFLGLLPGEQGAGAGAAFLAWMEAEVAGRSRNLWLCVSAGNTRARAFYARHGFAPAAMLDGLAAADIDEILMRKRLY